MNETNQNRTTERPSLSPEYTFAALSAGGGEGTRARALALGSTLAWTLGGVVALYLLGKAISYAGADLPYGCWQLTGVRAAASALVVGSLVSLRRGNLVLFGALYALLLLASHRSPMLLVSAVVAGAAAYGIQRRTTGSILRVISATLVFNLLLTLSSFVNTFGVDLHARTGFANYASGLGIRAAATVIIAAILLAVTAGRAKLLPRHFG